MILLDTCVAVWLSAEPGRLSEAAAQAIAAAEQEGGVAISAISLYELAWLVQNGRIQVAVNLDRYLARIESRFKVLPLSAEIASIAVGFPDAYPGDPMDRMIGATALSHGIALVTPDKLIRYCGAVPVVW